MRTIEIPIYKFEELNKRAQDHALETMMRINTEDCWWDCTYERWIGETYEDSIVVKDILSFDIESQRLKLWASPITSDDWDDEKEEAYEELLTELRKAILADLTVEYEYRISEEALLDMIKYNEYEFHADGSLA